MFSQWRKIIFQRYPYNEEGIKRYKSIFSFPSVILSLLPIIIYKNGSEYDIHTYGTFIYNHVHVKR